MLDFDEILVSVKNPQIKKYLEESIKSYGVRNYRSAILAVWIAAMFDLVKKFEILVEQRETTAIKKWNDLKPKIEEHKNWEYDLILAAEAVAMISRYEAETLKVLRKTRNRYAHPSFDDVGVLFDPTPEEVRYFIRTLYDIVLSQPAQLGAFYVTQLLEDIKNSNFFPIKLFADELVLGKDLVIEKINRINQKQLPRLVKELFQALSFPISKEHELNILCFIVNLCGVEAGLKTLTEVSSYWDNYILSGELDSRVLEAILNYPEYLNQLSEQSQKLIKESLYECLENDFRIRRSESFLKFLTSADTVPLAKSFLDDVPNFIPLDEVISQSSHYSYLFGSKFAEIFGEAIFNKTRQILKTRDGYQVNPALSALRRCPLWDIGSSLSSVEQKSFANDLILSLNFNNWETISLLSFSARNDIPIKWIKLLLEQWDEKLRTDSKLQRSFPAYWEHYLGLVERYTTELGNYSLPETVRQIVLSDEALLQLEEKDKESFSNQELWAFWRRLLLEHQHLITSTQLKEMI